MDKNEEKKNGSSEHPSAQYPTLNDLTRNAAARPGRSKLGKVVRNNGIGSLGLDDPEFDRRWSETKAVAEFYALPPGSYDAVLLSGNVFVANNGTQGFKLQFLIDSETDGQYKVSHTSWFTDRGLPHAKRDLAKVGIKSRKDLEKPVKAGLICEVYVAIEALDDGREFNRVTQFEVIGEGPSPFEHPRFPIASNDHEVDDSDAIDF